MHGGGEDVVWMLLEGCVYSSALGTVDTRSFLVASGIVDISSRR